MSNWFSQTQEVPDEVEPFDPIEGGSENEENLDDDEEEDEDDINDDDETDFDSKLKVRGSE